MRSGRAKSIAAGPSLGNGSLRKGSRLTCPSAFLFYRANVPLHQIAFCCSDRAWADRESRDGSETDFTSPSRSEEHTSELQSLMRISYAVFCLKKKKNTITTTIPK